MLQIINVSTHYGAIQALKGITFHVPNGQVVALIGANGAGKSTTLNTISGLLKPSEGSIRFEGQELNGLRADQVAALRLVQVPEGRAILAGMTVRENLLMGAYLRPNSEVNQDLERIFNRFPRLNERQNQQAGSLSGGEQQMLAIGRALMARPKLLMLDEPSMGLSPYMVNEVFQLIQAIKQEGTTILLVEQNAKKALQVADYAYVLERGQLAVEGRVEVLRANPKIVEAYLGS